MDSICMAFLRLNSNFFCFCRIFCAFQVLMILETKFCTQAEETNCHQYYLLKDLILAEFKFNPLWNIFNRWSDTSVLDPQWSSPSIFSLEIRIWRPFSYPQLRRLHAKLSHAFKLQQLFHIDGLKIHHVPNVQLVYPLFISLLVGFSTLACIW
jgi:hypothetical protein